VRQLLDLLVQLSDFLPQELDYALQPPNFLRQPGSCSSTVRSSTVRSALMMPSWSVASGAHVAKLLFQPVDFRPQVVDCLLNAIDLLLQAIDCRRFRAFDRGRSLGVLTLPRAFEFLCSLCLVAVVERNRPASTGGYEYMPTSRIFGPFFSNQAKYSVATASVETTTPTPSSFWIALVTGSRSLLDRARSIGLALWFPSTAEAILNLHHLTTPS
jgi:hypothetical protein